MIGRALSPFAAVLLLLATMTLSAQSSVPATARTIDEDVVVRLPYVPCQIPNVAVRIAQVLKVPAGAESVPEPCPDPQHPAPPVTGRMSLLGMTAREAFDALVRLDPRYRWVESGGVVVIRPVDAWEGHDHFLHRSMSSFAFTDENVPGALAALQTAIGPSRISGGQLPGRSPLAERRFSVSLGAISVYEALNAIVKAHGALAWLVGYCQPQVSYENSTGTLITFDGSGVGWRGPCCASGGDCP